MPLLSIQDLSIGIHTSQGVLHAVRNISFEVEPGTTLGLVGESGCGKSLTNLAIMDVLPSQAELRATSITFEGRNLLLMPPTERRQLAGKKISMIFQDPISSLNPCFTVGYQLEESIRRGKPSPSVRTIRNQAIDLLKRVGIASAEDRLSCFPHELSGGMCQRIMIAMAISCQPKLLIADEPTTALDVTIQAQILELLLEIQKENGMAMILVSHDMGVISQMSDRIAVMYAGEIVEWAQTEELMNHPRHPYTVNLIKCLPAHQRSRKTKLETIPGSVPNLIHTLPGCSFVSRCSRSTGDCTDLEPEWEFGFSSAHQYKCHNPL